MALLAVDDALQRMLADVEPVSGEACSLMSCRGRVLAENIAAPLSVPPEDNSAMDGYALRVADLAEGRALPVSQRIAAGAAPAPLMPGTAARIFTGATIPPGADCVVTQEDCEATGEAVEIRTVPRVGQHIRRAGQDIQRGQQILAAGQRLSPADLGLLASLGIADVPVSRRLRVALMSTGDELREPGEVLALGQIYNSNRPMLAALLEAQGHEVLDLGIVGDTAEATAAALAEGRDKADVVISSGGVSVGEEDHVKAQLEKLGRLQLWKLAIKPGKPLAYGRLGTVPFFGLPGNPVSSFVTYSVLVRPYLLRMQGCTEDQPVQQRAVADFDWPRPGSRQEYLRARVEWRQGRPMLTLHPQQSSGALSSVAWCNALAIVPIGATVARGEELDYIPMEALLH